MPEVQIRNARPEDRAALAKLRLALWPDSSVEEHDRELMPILAGKPPGIMPLVYFVAEIDGAVIGFVEVGLRSAADSCDWSHSVGYIEGWYVAGEHRRRGVGAQLIAAAENWAREQGCIEMASDTQLDNELSLRAHERLGYERRPLPQTATLMPANRNAKRRHPVAAIVPGSGGLDRTPPKNRPRIAHAPNLARVSNR